jgi:DNA-binding winged helix-turn-helix (wHTH) protein
VGLRVRLRFGEFVLDEDRRQLFRDGEEVRLGPKAYELLHALIRSSPRAVAKSQIRRRLWPEVSVGMGTLGVLMTELRAALGDNAKEPRFIRTVFGYGYAFAGEVVSEDPPATGRATGSPRVIWERRVIPLREGDNLVGRDDSAVVRIDVPGVSRRHARIVVRGELVTIEDLGSKNGTFIGVGETPVATALPLLDGACFRVGRVLLVFRSGAEAGSTATEADR